MNLPVHIKNKKPWVSISSFSNLLIDDVSFDSITHCKLSEAPEGFFGKRNIKQVVKELDDKTDSDISFIEDTLEVFFYNIEIAIEKLLDYLYFTNPVNLENPNYVDYILQNSINNISPDDVSLWEDKLLKEDLKGLLSQSFIDYEVHYDSNTNTSQCKVLFRYMPEGTQRSVVMDLVVKVPEDLDLESNRKYCQNELPDSLEEAIKLAVKEKWRDLYGNFSHDYQRELYRSIMSNKGGITIDEYFVKSFNFSKYNRSLDSRYLESKPDFKNIDSNKLNTYSSNVVNCIVHNSYNKYSVNSSFSNGSSGWNIVSKTSQINNSLRNLNSNNLVISNSTKTSSEDNEDIKLDKSYYSISQTLRLDPELKYKLVISMKSKTDRDISLFLGNEKSTFTLPSNENLQEVTLTDSAQGGISLRGYENDVVEYGIEVLDTSEDSAELVIEFIELKPLN